MRPISRRSFTLGGAAAGIMVAAGSLAGCGGSSAGSAERVTTVTTQLEYIFDVTFAGWYVAAQHGWFSQEGISSRLLPYGANIPSIAAVVAARKADIGTSSIQEVIEANKQGGDIIVFGTQYQQSPGGLLSLAKNPVRTIHDVLGKRIGLDPSAQLVLNVCLDEAGLPHDYTYVSVSGDPEPLVLGRVDAMAVFITSQPITLTLRGIPNVAVSFTKLGFPSYQNVLAARRETLQSDPGLLVRYLRALIRGWELNNANPTAGATYTYQKYGTQSALNLKQQILEDKEQVPLMVSALTARRGLFQMDLDNISGPQYEALSRSGVRNLPPVSSYVTLEILTEAYQGAKSLPD